MPDEIEDEEEEEQPKRRPRWVPKSDTFTGAYRGVPSTRHGGAQSVRDEDTLGDPTHCWCGLPFNHDWPGKSRGYKHPKEGEMPTSTTIDRTELRGFHSVIQDFILHEVNDLGLSWRIANNGLILYPPDGTRPITINMRNSDRQTRALTKWHTQHVEPVVGEQDVARKLAAVLNNPEEHPVKPEAPATMAAQEPPIVNIQAVVEPVQAVVEPVQVDSKGQDIYGPDENGKTPQDYGYGPEWHWHIGQLGWIVDGIVTDGHTWACALCKADGHEWTSTTRKRLGGHRRYNHLPDSAELQEKGQAAAMEYHKRVREERAAEAAAEPEKAAERYGVNSNFTHETAIKSAKTRTLKMKQLRDARGLLLQLCEVLDFYPSGKAPEGWVSPEDYAATVKRADDLQARLALLQEAFKNLD